MANRYVRSTGGNSNATGTWELTPGGGETVAVPTSSDDVYLVAGSGQLTINATFAAKTIDCTGYVNTLTHGAFSIQCAGSVTFAAGMTYTISSTSAILQMTATGTLITAGKLMPKILISGGAFTLGDDITFANDQTVYFSLRATSHNLSGRTISGYSTTSRVLVQSGIIGTSKPMTVDGSSTFVNCDFMDIAASAAIDLSGATGGSGDCGGNSNITFTTAAEQTWSGVTGNWSNSALWTSRIPLPQDNVVIPNPGAASRTLTADMPRLGKDITVTNTSAANKPTLNLNNVDNLWIHGSLYLVSSTYLVWNCTKNIRFKSRSNCYLTSAGQTFSGYLIPENYGATLIANDALSIASTRSIQVTAGCGFESHYSINSGGLAVLAGATANIENADIVLTSAGGCLNIAGSITSSSGSTISITYADSSATTCTMGSNTYNNIIIAPGTGILTFSGACTFNNMTMASAGAKTVKFTKSTTYTMTGSNFLSGTAGALITIDTNDGTGTWTLSKSSGYINCDYINLSRSVATGGALFYAGPPTPLHSVDGGGNIGWIWTAYPSPLLISGSYVRTIPWGNQKPDLGYGLDLDSPFAQGLVGCWLFNEQSGAIVNDIVYSRNATLANTPVWRNNALAISQSLSQYCTVYNQPPLKNRGYISLIATLTPSVTEFALHYCDSAIFGSRLQLSTTATQFILGNGVNANDTLDITSTAYFGKKSHYIWTWDGSTIRAYFDGKYINSVAQTSGLPSDIGNTHWIGAKQGVSRFTGTIDSLYRGDNPLSAAEIQYLYANPYAMVEGWNFNRSFSFANSPTTGFTFLLKNPLFNNNILVGNNPLFS